jgi:hypothetical protein
MVPYIYEGALRPLPDIRQQSDWYCADALKETVNDINRHKQTSKLRADMLIFEKVTGTISQKYKSIVEY